MRMASTFVLVSVCFSLGCGDFDPPASAGAWGSFERCCGAPGSQLGTCLPVELLPADQIDVLPSDSCRRPGTRCVPDELVDESATFTKCAANLLGVVPTLGFCLPECFVPSPTRLFTPHGTCEAPRRCVPCTSLNAGQPGCE
jgi:hypothetical protein